MQLHYQLWWHTSSLPLSPILYLHEAIAAAAASHRHDVAAELSFRFNRYPNLTSGRFRLDTVTCSVDVSEDPTIDDYDDGDTRSDTGEEDKEEEENGFEIEIEKMGKNRRRILSKIAVKASLQNVWKVITDYERLADFIPGLAFCQLLEKEPNYARLLQVQEAAAFLQDFHQPDMDDTLYPLSSGVNLACRKNIEEYMLHHLNIEETEVPKMCLELYREYGTTMAGLKELGYEFDNKKFHEFVHGKLPYEVLKPDPLIFTNGDKAHAIRVLSRLGLGDCFEGIICFETLNPADDTATILCRPLLKAMEAAIRIANLDPNKTIFFDDSARNIASGKQARLHTIIVGSSTLVAGADHALRSIHNIREALPHIWEEEGDLPQQIIQSNAAELTIVQA